MASFTSATTVNELVQYDGFIDAPTDLKVVLKETLLKYISHLYAELKAKYIAIKEIKNTFIESIETLNKNCINSVTEPIVTKIESLKSSVESNKQVNIQRDTNYEREEVSEEIPVEPFTAIEENVLSETSKANLNNIISTADFTSISDQRDVKYYGDYGYQYSGGSHEPANIPEGIETVLEEIRTKYPKYKEYDMNSILLTRYADGNQYCPAHSDNERSIDPTSDILTISLGSQREMIFTGISNPKCKKSVLLPANSLLIFSRKSQAYWRHEIPVVENQHDVGVRYSLTIRVIKPHYINSTVIYGDSNTRFLEFGDGEGKFGKWMPGQRIKTQHIQDIPSAENIYPYQNIVMNVGINDINRRDRKSASELVYQLGEKCRSIHKVYPTTRIYLSPLLPTKKSYLNEQIWEFNECVIALCKSHHNLMYLNNQFFADSNGLLKSEYGRYFDSNDSIHLGKTGLRAFAAHIKSYIVRKNPHTTANLKYSAAFKHGSH